MKKRLLFIAFALALVLAFTVAPAMAKPNGNGPKPGTDFSGPHFNLNIIGKDADWNGGGSYNNPDRHTMFVPIDTDGFTTPNGQDGITIWMTQDSEFAVTDGYGFDGECSFQLAPGHYKVYVVAKGKPGGNTDITGWVYYETDGDYYFPIGSVNVGGHNQKPSWKDATGIFYVSSSEDPLGHVTGGGLGEWVFDYLGWLTSETGYGATDAAYFWQFDNNGNKLIQVRFYLDE